MKPKSKLLSLLLAICLVVGIMPTAAFAANNDKAIQLGASNISGYDSTNGYDYIYYGEWDNSPIKWRVLDEQTNTQNEGLFLLSDVLLGTGTYGGVYFDNSGSDSNVWQNSTAQTWCKNFYSNNFSSKEQNAVLATTKSDSAYTSTYSGYEYGVSSLSGDKVFFLSAEEADNSAYGFTDDNARIANYGNSAGHWWLRSPDVDFTYIAGRVYNYGIVFYSGVYNGWAARPAFNLDLTSVLFTSAAVGGKSASGMDSGLTAVDDYTGSEWKLTLLDNSRNFSISNAAIEGSTVTFSYSNAKTGENEYISAIIKDNSGNITHYGRLKNTTEAADASGTVNIDLSGIDMTSKTLYVFSEQYNGDYMTDYASALQEISLNVLSKETTPQAVFTAAGDSSGTLSNVDASMKYSVDGGASWTDITGTTAEITGVTADKDIQVVKKGDGTATADSDAQIIDVTQAAIPVGIGKTDCTTAAQNDGTITGVDSTMEYRLSAASEWTSISGNTVSGLANGTYDVRVKANGTVLASEVATVTIGAHTCAAQGDWHSDETGHWNTCECGEKLNEAAHTFEWVIDKEATAAEAGSKHEECTVCGYAKAAVEIPATGETTSPETGDNSNIALWIAVMLAAGTALTGTVLYSRKRKYSR